MAKGAWAGCCIILPPGGSRGLEISRLRRHERVPSLHADQREATGPPEAAQRPAVFAGRRFDGKTAYDPVPFRESVNPASFATTRRISITSPAKYAIASTVARAGESAETWRAFSCISPNFEIADKNSASTISFVMGIVSAFFLFALKRANLAAEPVAFCKPAFPIATETPRRPPAAAKRACSGAPRPSRRAPCAGEPPRPRR